MSAMEDHPNTLRTPYNFKVDYPQEETVVEFVLNRVQATCQRKDGGNKRWITNTESGDFLTYSQVDSLSRKIASALHRKGMRKGDVVLYSSNDPHRMHVIMLGIWRSNGMLRAVYPEEDQSTIVERIVESKVKWLLCDAHTATDAIEATKKCPWPVEVISFGQNANCTSVQELFDDDGQACPALEIKGNDVAIILGTSGTTGKSKECLLLHSKLNKSFHTFRHLVEFGDEFESEPVLIMGRPTHMSGCAFGFMATITGRSLLMMWTPQKDNIFNAVHRYRPVLVFGFHKYLLYLVNDPDAPKYDLSSIRFVLAGGVVLTPEWIRTMKTLPNVTTVVVVYGMTENMIFTATRNFDPNTNSTKLVWPDVPDFSVGKLGPHTILQVRHIETGEPLSANERGELCFKTPISCPGYLNRPDDDKVTFSNGWVRTGDVGYYDSHGFVYVVDRMKDIFKYYNNHISPGELENVIQRHPAVDNVSVVGVPDPQGCYTIPRAFVTLKDPQALASDIRKFANDNLASYKHLRGGLIVLPEMPVGKTGKFNTGLLKQYQFSME